MLRIMLGNSQKIIRVLPDLLRHSTMVLSLSNIPVQDSMKLRITGFSCLWRRHAQCRRVPLGVC